MGEWVPIAVALIGSIGAIFAGLVALRKSSAEQANTMVDAASTVVSMMREELEAQGRRLDVLETAMLSWEGWGEKVLTLLDRLLGMLEEEQRAKEMHDVEEARRTRPRHHRKSVMHEGE